MVGKTEKSRQFFLDAPNLILKAKECSKKPSWKMKMNVTENIVLLLLYHCFIWSSKQNYTSRCISRGVYGLDSAQGTTHLRYVSVF